MHSSDRTAGLAWYVLYLSSRAAQLQPLPYIFHMNSAQTQFGEMILDHPLWTIPLLWVLSASFVLGNNG